MKTVLSLLLLVVTVFSLPSWSFAQDRDGNKLLADCEASIAIIDDRAQSLGTAKLHGSGRCLGFLQGLKRASDYYEFTKRGGLFCAPDSVTYGQQIRIVVKYLQNHPERLHEDEFILAATALRAAFPCPNKK